MTNSSANLAGRQSLRLLFLGLFLPSLVFSLSLLTTEPARAATTITVAAGGDFQQALDQAQFGDTILLAEGATFTPSGGPFILRYKGAGTGTDADWITIRTSAPDSSLPPPGQRITPGFASVLPKVVSIGFGHAAVQTEPRAHHYRFVGVEFRTVDSPAIVFDLIKFGDSGENQNTMDEVPHHLVLDRCYVHALPEQGLKRGIQLNSAHTDILNSYVEGFKTIGQDAQAAGGWNGPGPFRLINNYLEGAGQNVIFGGTDPSIPNLVPSDIEIRNNHFFKPPSWRNLLVSHVTGAAASLQPDAASTLVAGTRYYYRVCAVFSGFNATPCTPAAPTEVSQVAASGQAIRITWNAWSQGAFAASKYFVQRTTGAPGESRDWKWYDTVTTLSFTDRGQAEAPPGTFAVEAQWGVKNLFELKNARRVIVDGNIFENNWGHGQTGEAILFTVRNQDGTAPWSTIEDVVFSHNIVRHVGGGINILGHDYVPQHPSEQTKRVTIRNNLFDDMNGPVWSGRGELLLMTEGAADIVFDHNTIFHTGAITLLDDAPHTGFVFTNNIALHNDFGVFGRGKRPGTDALDRYTPGYIFRRNLIAGADPAVYPLDNYYPPASEFDAQFVNRAGGNYRLAPTSCGSMASTCNPKGGTDGKDVGADIDAVNAATAGAISGTSSRNIALGRFARQSSTAASGLAARAVDGNTNGDWAANSVTHTTHQSQPWWEVDLGSVRPVDRVDVWNRTDCCSQRLSNFHVFVSNVPFTSNSVAATIAQPNVSNYHFTGQAGTLTSFSINRSGRYVRIQLAGTESLSLAEVQVWGAASAGRTNLALAANGGVVSASSAHPSGNFPAAAVINGDRKGVNWGAGGGWGDGTQNQYPDWVQVDFGGSKTIEEVSVFTVQDNFNSPAEPTEATTFSLYGVTSFQVQYWNDEFGWVTVPGGSVTGNNKVWRKFTFAPVTTTKVRVLVLSALDEWSRITEVEVWEAARSNHALAANGAVATASSAYNANFPAAAVINGDRKGLDWGAGGGWNDSTLNQYPDWLEINFQGEKKVDEVSVFTLQDAFSAPAEPTETMTFSLYGVTTFDVEYWNGSQWVTVQGGSINGNNKVWRRLTFAEVTTTKIRVRVNAALDGHSRLTEVEAWGSGSGS